MRIHFSNTYVRRNIVELVEFFFCKRKRQINYLLLKFSLTDHLNFLENVYAAPIVRSGYTIATPIIVMTVTFGWFLKSVIVAYIAEDSFAPVA